MPKDYEAIKSRLLSKGMSLKKAKTIAAKEANFVRRKRGMPSIKWSRYK